MNGTTRRIGTGLGILAALAGFEHGLGEALQGSVAPSDWKFASWPDVAALDPLAGEPAMSLIPDLLVTGVVTMVVSLALLAVVLRRTGDLRTRLTTASLSVLLLLVGGGFFPPLFGLVAAALAGTGARAGAPTGVTARGTGLLVAYASKYGATREIAEVVADTLRDRGRPVDVMAVREVRDASAYDAVVLGSALYLGAPLHEADTFLERHRATLATRPVAVFASGPAGPVDDAAREQLSHALEKHPWLAPTATTVFGGRFDPAPLRGRERLVTALPASPLHGMAARDDRDWTLIRQWADELAPALG